MFLRAATGAVRSTASAQKRFFLAKPNNVGELRQKFYADRAKGEFLVGAPTYLRQTTDKASFAFAGGLLFVGLAMISKGLYNMSHGINKKSA